MKDFRDIVSKIPSSEYHSSAIKQMLAEYQLNKALKLAKKWGIRIPKDDFDNVVRRMYQRQPSTLLAMLGTIDIQLPYSVDDLLISAFKVGDYHGFLKQSYRLGVIKGFESQISDAIDAINKRNPQEAVAWRTKFNIS